MLFQAPGCEFDQIGGLKTRCKKQLAYQLPLNMIKTTTWMLFSDCVTHPFSTFWWENLRKCLKASQSRYLGQNCADSSKMRPITRKISTSLHVELPVMAFHISCQYNKEVLNIYARAMNTLKIYRTAFCIIKDGVRLVVLGGVNRIVLSPLKRK